MVKHSLSAGNSGDEQRKIMHRLLGRRWCVASFLAGVIWTFSLSLSVSVLGTSYASVPLCFIELSRAIITLCGEYSVGYLWEWNSDLVTGAHQAKFGGSASLNAKFGAQDRKSPHLSDIRACIKQTEK